MIDLLSLLADEDAQRMPRVNAVRSSLQLLQLEQHGETGLTKDWSPIQSCRLEGRAFHGQQGFLVKPGPGSRDHLHVDETPVLIYGELQNHGLLLSHLPGKQRIPGEDPGGEPGAVSRSEGRVEWAVPSTGADSRAGARAFSRLLFSMAFAIRPPKPFAAAFHILKTEKADCTKWRICTLGRYQLHATPTANRRNI
ncbi:hypothetical protein [Desulforhabdus amnigena]|uniref:hypothetical protein n=1 Tax=Desulforhabdus amnigena TaxID=40218 RepID=UPI002490611D|nr:hypothetical protein [Desulforhabdus amnigena]